MSFVKSVLIRACMAVTVVFFFFTPFLLWGATGFLIGKVVDNNGWAFSLTVLVGLLISCGYWEILDRIENHGSKGE